MLPAAAARRACMHRRLSATAPHPARAPSTRWSVCRPCVHAVATTPAQRRTVLCYSIRSVVSTFPGRVAGSACASSFSRFAQRSLTLRPTHSRCHRILWHAYSRRIQRLRYLHRCSGSFRREHFAGWDLHPLEQHHLFTAHTRSSHSHVSKAVVGNRNCCSIHWAGISDGP